MAQSRFTSVKDALRYLADSRLSDREVWAVVTALRGPDSKDDNDTDRWVKRKTTCVIRGLLFSSLRWADYVPNPTKDHVASLHSAIANKSSHFNIHIRNAMAALRKIRKAAREGYPHG